MTDMESLDGTFFDEFYSGARDPWGFETRWYESRKRDLTMAALTRPRFNSVLELGCSIGVLTERLVERADQVLALDVAEAPLEAARARLAAHSAVRFERRTVPAEWPAGTFDLIVVSEMAYYLGAADLQALLARIVGALRPEGAVVTCHWLHPVTEYPQTGADVRAAFAAEPGLQRTVAHEEKDFALDVWETPPGRSVAERSGLA